MTAASARKAEALDLPARVVRTKDLPCSRRGFALLSK